jgi:AraC family transcriptional regulator
MSAIKQVEEAPDAQLRPGEFYGEVVKESRCAGLVFSELRHGAGRVLGAHSHELANFCLLLGGHYSEEFGGRTFTYRPLTVVFHPPSWAHRDEVGGQGGHFFSVELESQWMEKLRGYASPPGAVLGGRGGDLSWMAHRLYREFRLAESASPLAVEGLTMAMLGDVLRGSVKEEQRRPVWLRRAVEILHEEFRENLTIGYVAAEVGVHPFHLSKVFRKFHGQAIGGYVNALRVEFACRELETRDKELADIALDAGFADQSHLTRVFKRLTGTTPGAFRAGRD